MIGQSSRILVVDGCEASRNATHRMLHGLGYRNIDYAPDSRVALRLIGQNNYRLVLADGDIAPTDGQDLLRQTRVDRRLRYLPFVMSIARWQKKFIEIVRDDGATLYLTKPFTAETLAERMAQVDSDATRLKNTASQVEAAESRAPRGMSMVPKLWQSLRHEL